MARILCIDTEANTAEALMAAGHEVFAGTLGYTDGHPRLAMPPHEADMLVCDLRTPACFDSNWWGPGRNDNYHCQVVPDPPVQWKQIDRGGVVARFQIIQAGQMNAAPPGSFGSEDIHRAISKAGVPLFLMLNPEWLNHMGYHSPDFAGVRWRFKLTRAERVEINEPLASTFPEVERQHRFVRPLQFEIVEAGNTIGAEMRVSQVVTNAVGQQFGQMIQIGKGAIWALPKLEDNVGFLTLAASRVDAPRPAAAEARPPMAGNDERDVFISHASEDKDAVARPLAEALIGGGASVWFDEYELRLGDRLRAKIEDGLRRSRFGAVILSHSFFAKRWPQLELDGLFALEAD